MSVGYGRRLIFENHAVTGMNVNPKYRRRLIVKYGSTTARNVAPRVATEVSQLLVVIAEERRHRRDAEDEDTVGRRRPGAGDGRPVVVDVLEHVVHDDHIGGAVEVDLGEADLLHPAVRRRARRPGHGAGRRVGLEGTHVEAEIDREPVELPGPAPDMGTNGRPTPLGRALENASSQWSVISYLDRA